jgi:proton glutamate symport protein
LLVFVISIVIFGGCTVVIKLFTGKRIGFILKAMKEVIIISLGTRNSFAAIPSAIDASQNMLGLQKDIVNLVLPLGITMCRFGNVMLFSVFSIFAARLYHHSIDIQTVFIIATISILAAMAASGAPGIVARTMIAMVLTPLGIPSQAIIIMLITIDPMIDPITTLINIYPNCAATAVIAGSKKFHPKYVAKEGCFDA